MLKYFGQMSKVLPQSTLTTATMPAKFDVAYAVVIIANSVLIGYATGSAIMGDDAKSDVIEGLRVVCSRVGYL